MVRNVHRPRRGHRPMISMPRFSGQLEDNHRSQLVSQKRQWSATAEAQTDDARKMLKSELDKTRADHSREIDTLERNLIDAQVRLEKAKDETEQAREAAMKEKRELELALDTLRREVLEEKGFLEEAREAAQKEQVAEAIPADGRLRAELTRVVSELEDERKYVTELENQLKEADNGADLPSSALRAVGLEKRLDFVLPGDDELRKKEAPGADFVATGSGKRTAASEGEANKHNRDQECNKLADLKRALKEAGAKLADLQQTKYRIEQVKRARHGTAPTTMRPQNLRGTIIAIRCCQAFMRDLPWLQSDMVSRCHANKRHSSLTEVLTGRAVILFLLTSCQDAKNTAVALVEIQKKAASLEFDNNRLADQVSFLMTFFR